jgi:hypothetical protein
LLIRIGVYLHHAEAPTASQLRHAPNDPSV